MESRGNKIVPVRPLPPDNIQTVAIGYLPELGYEPGDGYVYFIATALGRSKIRRLGLVYMSDAWKEYMIDHCEMKKPARRASHNPPRLIGERS